MKSRIHRPGTCRPKTQMATQRCCLSELRADSRCSLSIVDDEIKDTSTWHLSSKGTNGDTNMLPVRTMCKLKMFTVNSWWWNQGYIDLAPVVQKDKWRHKYASCQNYMRRLKMFTVNSWWWNQGYIDLAPVVQKQEWLHKNVSFRNQNVTKLQHHKTTTSQQTLLLTHTHTHSHSHTLTHT